MSFFFLLFELELTRETMEGKWEKPRDVVLPGVAAFGGMALPAVVFVLINRGIKANLRGWANSATTENAFAVCIPGLEGERAPVSSKVFLSILAIHADLGAVIIALF